MKLCSRLILAFVILSSFNLMHVAHLLSEHAHGVPQSSNVPHERHNSDEQGNCSLCQTFATLNAVSIPANIEISLLKPAFIEIAGYEHSGYAGFPSSSISSRAPPVL